MLPKQFKKEPFSENLDVKFMEGMMDVYQKIRQKKNREYRNKVDEKRWKNTMGTLADRSQHKAEK